MGAGQDYVHGYSRRERERLADQANTLVNLLHSDTSYPSGSVVLEVGCGAGAQTIVLAKRSLGRDSSPWISPRSLWLPLGTRFDPPDSKT